MTAPSEQIIQQVRAECGPRIMLSFSRGKDCIAAYIAMRDSFEEIVAYHLFVVPGLEFVEESLDYYRRKLGIKIYNLPHPWLYKSLNSYVFQTPAHAAVIDAANLPIFTYSDVHRMVAAESGLGDKVLVASGVRAADSPMRRIALMTHGAISRNQRQFYPVWDWDKARVVDAIEQSGIRLPVDYELFGRSFDGLDLRFILPLKKHRPADYRKILEWFPLVELEVFRFERYGKNAA